MPSLDWGSKAICGVAVGSRVNFFNSEYKKTNYMEIRNPDLITAFSWAPDGEQFAVAIDSGVGSDVATCDVNTLEVVRMGTGYPKVGSLAWKTGNILSLGAIRGGSQSVTSDLLILKPPTSTQTASID